MRSNTYLTLTKGPREKRIGHRPRERYTVIILLKEQSNEVTTNDILLYPLSSISSGHHQKSVFLQ